MSTQDKDTFTIMTYNIGYMSGMSNNRPVRPDRNQHRENMQATISLLQSLDPDFIGFQEIDFNSDRSFEVNQLDTLAKYLDYPYGLIGINWDKNYVPFPYWPPQAHFGQVLSGQAILSRFSFGNHKREVLPKPGASFTYNRFYLDRLIQITQVEVGRPLVLMNIHLEAFDEEARIRQTRRALDLFREYSYNYPVILIGDFNSPPPFASGIEPDHSALTEFYSSPFVNSGISEQQYRSQESQSLTFNSEKPYVKLDYIMYSPETIIPISSRVVTEANQISDHLPVITSFTFRP